MWQTLASVGILLEMTPHEFVIYGQEGYQLNIPHVN